MPPLQQPNIDRKVGKLEIWSCYVIYNIFEHVSIFVGVATSDFYIWVCLKIVYPYTQWLLIIIPTKWL